MLRVADKSKLFDQEDLLDLDTEISNYTNLEDTETPKFGKQDQTDTSY